MQHWKENGLKPGKPLIQLKAKTSNGWGNVEQVDLQLQQNQVKLLLQPSKGSGLRATKLAQPTTKMHHLWLFKAHSNITKQRTNGWYFFWRSFYIFKIWIIKRLSSHSLYSYCRYWRGTVVCTAARFVTVMRATRRIVQASWMTAPLRMGR